MRGKEACIIDATHAKARHRAVGSGVIIHAAWSHRAGRIPECQWKNEYKRGPGVFRGGDVDGHVVVDSGLRYSDADQVGTMRLVPDDNHLLASRYRADELAPRLFQRVPYLETHRSSTRHRKILNSSTRTLHKTTYARKSI